MGFMKFLIFFSSPQRNAANDAWEVTGTLKQVMGDGTRRTVLWASIPIGQYATPEDARKYYPAYAQDLKDIAKAAIQAAEVEE